MWQKRSIYDLLNALAFLTILPVKFRGTATPGRMLAFAPLVGLLIGAVVSAAGMLPVRPELRALAALALWVGLTGGLHLDGFADSCDGLLAAVDPERRLAIMHDPRAGSWAVVGLILLLLGKWVGLLYAAPAALIVIPASGRWAMVLAAYGFSPARVSGSAVYFREGLGLAQTLTATAMTVFAALVGSIFIGWEIVSLLLIGPLGVWLIGGWASRRLGGGLTGDVYGAICEITEGLCLILIALRN